MKRATTTTTLRAAVLVLLAALLLSEPASAFRKPMSGVVKSQAKSLSNADTDMHTALSTGKTKARGGAVCEPKPHPIITFFSSTLHVALYGGLFFVAFNLLNTAFEFSGRILIESGPLVSFCFSALLFFAVSAPHMIDIIKGLFSFSAASIHAAIHLGVFLLRAFIFSIVVGEVIKYKKQLIFIWALKHGLGMLVFKLTRACINAGEIVVEEGARLTWAVVKKSLPLLIAHTLHTVAHLAMSAFLYHGQHHTASAANIVIVINTYYNPLLLNTIPAYPTIFGPGHF